MKGSPILSTITAILIMAGAYLWLHLSMQSEIPAMKNSSTSQNDQHMSSQATLDPDKAINAYIVAHFSSPPSNFTLSDAVTGKPISVVSNLTDNEWSGEIHVSKGATAELTIQVTWDNDDNADSSRQNFIQLILSPDQMEDSEVTLRNTGAIDTTASFKLKP